MEAAGRTCGNNVGDIRSQARSRASVCMTETVEPEGANRVTVANSLAGTVCTFDAGLLSPIVLLAHWLPLSLTRRDTICMRSTQQDGENQIIGKQVCLMLSNLLI